MKQDDDDTDREISDDNSEDPGESNLSSDIDEDNLDTKQEVLHLDQACRDRTVRKTKVPLSQKRSRVDTVIARTSLPNLRHPAGAIAPSLLKCQKSAINILRESAIVPAQALQLPKAARDQSVPQLMAGGDHNIIRHQKATFGVVKQFMESIVITKTPWPIISDEMYPIVDEDSQLAIEAHDCQRALTDAPMCTPSMSEFPVGPSPQIDLQTGRAVSVYSVFCFLIGCMMILNPKNMDS